MTVPAALDRPFHRSWDAPSPVALIGWAVALVALAAAIALLSPLALVVGALGLCVVVLLLVRPILGLPLLLAAVPYGDLVPFPEIGSLSFGITEILVALFLVAWVASGIRQRTIRLHGEAVVGAILAFIALMVLSITYAISAAAAVKETLKWVELLIVLLGTIDLVRDRRTMLWLVGGLFVICASEAFDGLSQSTLNLGPSFFLSNGSLRAYGTFDQPNPFAGYLAMVFPLALILCVLPIASRRYRIFSGVAAALLLGAVAVSQSRGAWLALALAMLVFLILWSHRTRLLLIPTFGVSGLLAISATMGLLPQSISGRLTQAIANFGVFDVRTVDVTPENYSVVERMAHWQAGWYMWLANPWLGVGAGNYPAAYPQFYVAGWIADLGHAHNYYLNTAAELGVVGLLLLLLILWTVYRRLLSTVRLPVPAGDTERLFWRAIVAGVLCGLVVFCVHNMFDDLFVHAVNVQVGFLIGIGLIAANRLVLPSRRAGL